MAPAFAGQYEDALWSGRPVFLYLYTDECSYCKKFNSIYDKLVHNYQTCQFIKVNATTKEGRALANSFMAGYVPYTVILDAKRKIMLPINPECAIDYVCIDKEVKNFLK
ncbi:MAG: thioredoxin family protein [bacterium]|nr:thioredoxin family protein [bacterium]